VAAGADAVGLILTEASPRRVTLADARTILRAVPAYVSVVAVFVRPQASEVAAALALGCLAQFSGDESPEFCNTAGGLRYIKALHFAAGQSYAPADAERMAGEYPDADLMFDSQVGSMFGGTGTTGPWELIAPIARQRRVIVSGGLTPENVGACVRRVRPFGVDVRSGVETGGVKDGTKVRAFVTAVRESDAEA
jgi:phosphoribosylanthranilate isomerase